MARRSGAYRGEKRRKELSRQKKKKEKLQRRLDRKESGEEAGPPIAPVSDAFAETPSGASEVGAEGESSHEEPGETEGD